MELISKTIERYQPELMKFISGSAFIIFCVYEIWTSFNPQILFLFSTTERIIAFIILSFVIGEFGFQLGDFITASIAWIFFQKDKKLSLENMKTSLSKYMSFGSKSIDDKGLISRPEILSFIERQASLKIMREDVIRGSVFWKTQMGISLMVLLLFKNSSEIRVILVILGISVLQSLYHKLKISQLWHDCARQLRRDKTGISHI